MNIERLAPLVLRAIRNVCLRDSELIQLDASEWAFAHRLAVYLEHEIPGWNVDCEYNRQGIHGDAKTDPHGTILRPDIIVHRRGNLDAESNLLVIEIKKRRDRDDETKAKAYTQPPRGERKFQYQFGLSLHYLPEVDGQWYASGRKFAPLFPR